LPAEIIEGQRLDAEMPLHVLEALILQRYLAEEIPMGCLAELLGFT
jgi:hypothetical protein